jgi:hypothetical protein
MNPEVEQIIALLEDRPHSPTVTNPYRLAHRSDNLRAYLGAMLDRRQRRILLVGEALGYRGGLLTGIPFSSCSLLNLAPHPFLRSLRERIRVSGHSGEATAAMVWDYLRRRRTLPLFWNAFPFHPHLAGRETSNRAPDAAESAEGRRYLQLVWRLYRPQRVAGLGRKGTDAASRAFPDHPITHIRHPSYGGKREFVRGMDALFGG